MIFHLPPEMPVQSYFHYKITTSKDLKDITDELKRLKINAVYFDIAWGDSIVRCIASGLSPILRYQRVVAIGVFPGTVDFKSFPFTRTVIPSIDIHGLFAETSVFPNFYMDKVEVTFHISEQFEIDFSKDLKMDGTKLNIMFKQQKANLKTVDLCGFSCKLFNVPDMNGMFALSQQLAPCPFCGFSCRPSKDSLLVHWGNSPNCPVVMETFSLKGVCLSSRFTTSVFSTCFKQPRNGYVKRHVNSLEDLLAALAGQPERISARTHSHLFLYYLRSGCFSPKCSCGKMKDFVFAGCKNSGCSDCAKDNCSICCRQSEKLSIFPTDSCSVCFGDEPDTRLSCGHVICSVCFRNPSINNLGFAKCPICRNVSTSQVYINHYRRMPSHIMHPLFSFI